ncbi:MAG: hypothetical protein ABI690_00920 [Chloroflexota bacterium]
MELIGLALCIFGLAVILGTPLICTGVVIKWADLVSWSAPNLPYPGWVKKLLGTRFLVHIIIFATFIVIIRRYLDRATIEGRFAGIFDAVINPLWILICLSGFWLARNFSTGSASVKKWLIAVGFAGYCLFAGWLTLVPLSFVENFQTLFFYLSPLNFLLGFTFLRTSTGEPPNGRRPLKYIIRDVAIGYAATFFCFAFISTLKVD